MVQRKPKYRITVIHKLGPVKTVKDVTTAKQAIKKKMPKMVFSVHKKQRNGYTFTGKIVYTKSIDASKAVVTAAVKKLAPKANVTVARVN